MREGEKDGCRSPNCRFPFISSLSAAATAEVCMGNGWQGLDVLTVYKYQTYVVSVKNLSGLKLSLHDPGVVIGNISDFHILILMIHKILT